MPSRLRTSLSALRANLWMILGILDKLGRAMDRHVVGVRSEYGNVLRSVVSLVMVQVMNALSGQKIAPQLGFGHEAMLIDISVSIRGGIVWRIHVHVPALVGIATALPPGTIWTLKSFGSMALAISIMLSSTYTTLRVAGRGNGRDLTATTHTQARRIWFLLDLPASMIHLFGRFGPGPVALDVTMPFGNLCTTTA